jgi:predicted DNA-binding transcriptional regulator YafY
MSQTERIIWIDKKLAEGEGITSARIAKAFEISTRQAKRDIEYMRDRFQAKIDFVKGENAYYYQKGFVLSYSHTNEKMMILNAIVKNFSRNAGLLPLAQDLLKQSFQDGIGTKSEILSHKIEFISPIIDLPDQNIFSKVLQAMERNKRIAMEYKSISAVITRRHIEPVKLVCVGSAWYVIAFDTIKKALRNFHLSRISNLSILEDNNTFHISEEEMQKYINSGFGVYMGSHATMVQIAFTGIAVNEIQTQIWHHDQTTQMVGETLLLTLPVANLMETVHKILSFGSLATPIKPQELVDLWKEEIVKLVQLTK